jgi:hypothetical protein
MFKSKRIVAVLLLLCILFSLNTSACFVNKQEKLTSYDIECSFIDNILIGKEKVSFYNYTDNTFSELKFNLYPNAFREDAKYPAVSPAHYSQSYYNGASFGEIKILSVSDVKASLNYLVEGEDENVLTVELREEIFPEERVEIIIEFETILAGVIARTGYNLDTINLANFYPILCGIENESFFECVYYSNGDPFFSECANYTVKFKADKQFKVASSGELINKVENEKSVTYNYKIDKARSFALVLSEKFNVLTKKQGEVKVNYYYYKDSNPEKSLNYALQSMSLFSSKFGDFIYKEYSVVQTKFVQGGMEFSALVMISDNLEESAYGEVIVHETAHQWWQTAVGNNEINHSFLDEGLTEYSVVIFYENYPSYGFTRQQLVSSSEKTFKAFCSVYDKLFGMSDTRMLRSLKEFSSEYEYVNIAYVKPCIMFDSLRTTIGDEKFFSALKKYYSDYKYKVATPDDLVGSFEKVNSNANGFFNSFFNGKAIL